MDARDFDKLINPVDLLEPKLIENIDEFLSSIVDNKMIFGLVVDGVPGTSKTTSASICARYIQPNFDEAKQLGAGIDEFIKAYNWTAKVVKSKYKVVIYDEANDSDKSASKGRINRILNQLLLASNREEKIIIIVLLHRFYRLDNKFIDNSLIHMLIHMVHKSNNKYVKFNAYDIDSMLWMNWQLSRKKIAKAPLVYKSTSPNFGGIIKSPPVEYIKFIDSLSKVGKDLLRKKASKEILSQNYYSIPTLASMLGVSKTAVSYQMESNDLKKKFLREQSGVTKYYDKDIYFVLKKIFKRIEDKKSLNQS